jgi:hypothetical protein
MVVGWGNKAPKGWWQEEEEEEEVELGFVSQCKESSLQTASVVLEEEVEEVVVVRGATKRLS